MLYQVIKVILHKLKYGAINNKKIIMFLLGLCVIGIISGSIFITLIKSSDKTSIINYINDFISNIGKIDIKNALINSLLANIIFTLIIWLLGISVIGIPIILFMYFSKLFILGFTISSFILTYKLKGLLFAFLYVFPTQVINILIYTLISLYAIKISNNLIYTTFNKKDTNFKKITNKYIKILIICLICILLNSLYESVILPFILNKVILLLKI